MSHLKQAFIAFLILAGMLLFNTHIERSQAQTQMCQFDARAITEIVESACGEMGDNAACYGNEAVEAVLRREASNTPFSTPGDTVDLVNLNSLYLSALNEEMELWGIARMNLIARQAQGTQNLSLLLFGDTSIENRVPETTSLDVPVGQYAANIRSTPSLNSGVIASVDAGETLTAVGRLENTDWLRVEVPITGAVGWVASDVLALNDISDADISSLTVQAANEPYFGPMQAFYFQSGSTPVCSNVASDGLLIQTPEGIARVTVMINEVTIDFVSNGGGGTTSFVQSNSDTGMQVSMIEGSAYVSSDGTEQYVGAGTSTTIEVNEDSQATSPPSTPVNYEPETLRELPLLPVIGSNPEEIIEERRNNRNNSSNTNGRDNAGDNGNGQGNGNSNGQGNGQGNGNSNGQSNGQGNGNGNGQGNGNGNGQGNGNSNGQGNGNSNGQGNGQGNGNGNG